MSRIVKCKCHIENGFGARVLEMDCPKHKDGFFKKYKLVKR